MIRIRKVLNKDINKIFNIYKTYVINKNKLNDFHYRRKLKNRGFFPGLDTKDTYIKLITKSDSFLIAEENSDLLGYIISTREKEYKEDEYKTWTSLEIKQFYYNNPQSISIYAIAVKEKSTLKSIATKLLQELEKELSRKHFRHLFSIVIVSPISNTPSINFHLKNGFKRVIIAKPRKLFNLPNYASSLFYKKI